MKTKIKDDERLLELSLKCIYVAIGLLALRGEVIDGLTYMVYVGTNVYSTELVNMGYIAFLLLIVLYAGFLQIVRIKNKETIRHLILDGYKMQVEVAVHDKRVFTGANHRIRAIYAYYSSATSDYFFTPYIHESLEEKIPVGTRLDMYVDANDPELYYIDISKYHKQESLLGEIKKTFNIGRKKKVE